EPEPCRIRLPSGCNQHSFGFDPLLSALGGDVERDAGPGLPYRPRCDPVADDDPLVAEIAFERRRDLRLAGRENRQDIDDRYRAACARRPLAAPAVAPHVAASRGYSAGAREHLAELAADIAAADDEQRAREHCEVESRRAG